MSDFASYANNFQPKPKSVGDDFSKVKLPLTVDKKSSISSLALIIVALLLVANLWVSLKNRNFDLVESNAIKAPASLEFETVIPLYDSSIIDNEQATTTKDIYSPNIQNVPKRRVLVIDNNDKLQSPNEANNFSPEFEYYQK